MLLLLLMLPLALGACDAAAAQERVALRATHPDGVPLHQNEGDRAMSGRVPDGTVVDVLGWGDRRRWLEVHLPDGRRAWISARYLARPEVPALDSVWRSAASCEGATPPSRAPGHERIASWNLRWFPDGSSRGPSEHATDVGWAACAIAALNVDVVALQEIMLHDRGRAAIDRLTRRLSERTGGRWQSRFDSCPRDGRQHVGWLFDASRVQLTDVRQLDDINPLGACTGHLRPGLAASARWGHGRRLTLITVHLDSGTDDRDYRHRVESVRQLAAGATEDMLVLGDFNTMGTDQISGSRELADLDAALSRSSLRRLNGDVACTEFYRSHGGLLDLALVSTGLRSRASIEVAGPCAQLHCVLPRGTHPEALNRLSDHCPIVVDLAPDR